MKQWCPGVRRYLRAQMTADEPSLKVAGRELWNTKSGKKQFFSGKKPSSELSVLLCPLAVL